MIVIFANNGGVGTTQGKDRRKTDKKYEEQKAKDGKEKQHGVQTKTTIDIKRFDRKKGEWIGYMYWETKKKANVKI